MANESIYWVLLESDISNPDLYLPPDTPIGSVNPKKLFNIYKKRHARQKERLVKQQVANLYEYRKLFSIEHKDDNFLKTTSTACELISGSDFLKNESESISQLLSDIPSYAAENHAIKTQRFKPDQTEKHKQEYLEILTKKFKAGSENLEINHQTQLESLERIQRLDLKTIPSEILYELDYRRSESTSPSSFRDQRSPDTYNDRRKRPKDEKDESRKRKKARTSDRDGKRGRYQSSPTSTLPRDNNKKDSPFIIRLRPPTPPPPTPTPPPPPPPASIIGIPNNLKPPTVVSSSAIHNNNNNIRPPNVISTNSKKIMRPPFVTSHTSKYHKETTPSSTPTNNNRPSSLNNERRTSIPLFTNRSIQRVETLMDRGSLLIQNKPNRVIIRDTNGKMTAYGDPKDYDDAIHNNKSRIDNPVYKRYMNGAEYLFYKTDKGNVVTIGPVSKIQPLIHKFFLSM